MADTEFKTILEVPADHPVFVDHFPNDPLVPGALLIDWLIKALQAHTGRVVRVVPNMKFLSPLRPADRCQCIFQIGDKTVQVSVKHQVQETLICKGKFVLAEAVDDNG